MDYDKKEFIGGKWADKAALYEKRVAKAKIVSETNPEASTTYTNDDGTPKMRDVCKVLFQGETESVKVELNRATINALVDAFGRSSAAWQGHILSVEIDKLPGKKFPMYLIPDGYKRIEDENGYSVITKQEAPAAKTPTDSVNATLNAEADKEIKIEEIPF